MPLSCQGQLTYEEEAGNNTQVKNNNHTSKKPSEHRLRKTKHVALTQTDLSRTTKNEQKLLWQVPLKPSPLFQTEFGSSGVLPRLLLS